MKLYEILLRKAGLWRGKSEDRKVYNPLNARVGCPVSVNTVYHQGQNFLVQSITACESRGQRWTDYEVLARPIGGEEVRLKLRSVTPDSVAVLRLDDDFGYSQDFRQVLNDNNFIVKNDGQPDEEFFRVGGVKKSHAVTRKTLEDLNSDGRIDPNEVRDSKVEMWDYSRSAEIDGVQTEEFLFVELDKDNGWFQIWRGEQVLGGKVVVWSGR